MAQNVSDEALKKATGKTDAEWCKLLDKAGAKDMKHMEIARFLYDQGLVKEGWWAQTIAVAYEQHIGRRSPGQNSYGEFVAGASKTLAGTLDSVAKQWHELTKKHKDFMEVQIEGKPRASSSEKWRYWHADLVDGSKIDVTMAASGKDKVQLAVQHRRVADEAAHKTWKSFWKEFLGRL